MKRFLAVLTCVATVALGFTFVVCADEGDDFLAGLRSSIERHLGRPYVWGSTGLKSFDCSGFVWRVMYENGILIKRTTARKLYMCLPSVPEEKQWTFGNIVFFDDLKHCGIVASQKKFYHSETSTGTNLSSFDPYWRRKIVAIRSLK
jgi:cell wall-associated NlpC family hydrolase